MWSRVDLPAPFGPSSPVTPGRRANEMSLTATTLPYQRETSWSSTVAVGSSGAATPDGARTAASPQRRVARRSCLDPQVAPDEGERWRRSRERPPRGDNASTGRSDPSGSAGADRRDAEEPGVRPVEQRPDVEQDDPAGRPRRRRGRSRSPATIPGMMNTPKIAAVAYARRGRDRGDDAAPAPPSRRRSTTDEPRIAGSAPTSFPSAAPMSGSSRIAPTPRTALGQQQDRQDADAQRRQLGERRSRSGGAPARSTGSGRGSAGRDRAARAPGRRRTGPGRRR